MLRLNYLVAACVLALTIGTADANPVTFDASGTFDSASSGINLSGTLTVDVNAGSITAVDLLVTGFAPFNIMISNSSNLLQAESSDFVDYLFLTFPPSLVGYNGGSIFSGSTTKVDTNGCEGCDRHSLFSGNFTPENATTPLPPTWLMLLSGFVGLGFFAYRGTKKNAALAAA